MSAALKRFGPPVKALLICLKTYAKVGPGESDATHPSRPCRQRPQMVDNGAWLIAMLMKPIGEPVGVLGNKAIAKPGTE
jgi:hypothetical protein